MLSKILTNEGYIEIPLLETLVGLFELHVKIDGIKTKFVLDTGAGNTVVDSAFAKENDLIMMDTDIMGGGVGTSSLTVHKKHVDLFQIADFSLTNFELYAVD